MQKIKYLLCQRVNIGTEEEPKYEEVLYGKKLPYSEANLELANAEAYNGEYEIFDDGQPEPEVVETTDDVLNALLGVSV